MNHESISTKKLSYDRIEQKNKQIEVLNQQYLDALEDLPLSINEKKEQVRLLFKNNMAYAETLRGLTFMPLRGLCIDKSNNKNYGPCFLVEFYGIVRKKEQFGIRQKALIVFKNKEATEILSVKTHKVYLKEREQFVIFE